jgi:hypothetical protein
MISIDDARVHTTRDDQRVQLFLSIQKEFFETLRSRIAALRSSAFVQKLWLVEAIAALVIADAQERSTNDKVRYQWELLLGNSLLQKPINQITTLDIEQVLRPVWRSKPETGRKLPGALAPSLRLCPCSPTGPARHRYAEQPGCLAGSAGPGVRTHQ